MEWHLDKRIIDFGISPEGAIVIDWNDGRRSSFDPLPYLKGDFMGKLTDPDYFALAYVLGHGRGIAWPENQDFGVSLLYDKSETVNAESPLPPHGPRMTWSGSKLILQAKPNPEGDKLAIQWSDGTTRLFSTWDHADNNAIEALANPAYFAQVSVVHERDAVAWPGGERFDAKTLYELSALVEG